ncbi:MAG TPA: hypothetical protein VE136_03300 [Anaerolineales bacterium]|nr:hypothetical protein [Anaerolineales bacterium]
MKITRIHFLLFLTSLLSLTLAACSDKPAQPAAASEPQTSAAVAASNSDKPARQREADQPYWVEGQPKLDEQGAVSVEITPLNLNNAWESIDFQVAMNTHSVGLSMDLASLATLTTDTGYSIQASSWDAPSGGHHVRGKLSFPASTETGSVLDGAEKITLTLTNVDAPERVFVWERGG